MSAEIACKQNILVTDFHLLKLLLVVLGFDSQTNICGFSRQNICSVQEPMDRWGHLDFLKHELWDPWDLEDLRILITLVCATL